MYFVKLYNHNKIKIMRNNKILGIDSKTPNTPLGFKFDLIKNLNKSHVYNVRFSIPEFTSICPVTAQPDFGMLVIDYVPKNWLVESKSLKTYIHSFRNYGIFHEEAVMKVGLDIYKSTKPIWFRILGYFAPRGGIPIDVFWQSGKKPLSVVVPDLTNSEKRLFIR